jgi:rSAM/selenodomain-associated transferase 1
MPLKPGPERFLADSRLIVFARQPTAGRAKTRLIPALGAIGAARLHRRMVERTLDWACELAATTPLELELRTDGRGMGVAAAQRTGLRLCAQGPGNLGERMVRAFAESFDAAESAPRRVAIIGTDCPRLDGETVTRAFAELDTHDVVVGPAIDGGYYLIGLRAPAPALFGGVHWGTGRVFDETVDRARSAGLSVAALESLEDVDRPEDLVLWTRVTGEPVDGDG